MGPWAYCVPVYFLLLWERTKQTSMGGGKGLFGLRFFITTHHQPGQELVAGMTHSLELQHGPWREVVYWLDFHDLLRYCFLYNPEPPAQGGSVHSGPDHPPSINKENVPHSWQSSGSTSSVEGPSSWVSLVCQPGRMAVLCSLLSVTLEHTAFDEEDSLRGKPISSYSITCKHRAIPEGCCQFPVWSWTWRT